MRHSRVPCTLRCGSSKTILYFLDTKEMKFLLQFLIMLMITTLQGNGPGVFIPVKNSHLAAVSW
jgi:hypothetical protein